MVDDELGSVRDQLERLAKVSRPLQGVLYAVGISPAGTPFVAIVEPDNVISPEGGENLSAVLDRVEATLLDEVKKKKATAESELSLANEALAALQAPEGPDVQE